MAEIVLTGPPLAFICFVLLPGFAWSHWEARK